MKTSRRMISAFLAVIFVLTSIITVPVFAADFTDLTSEHDAYEAVNVLGKLGVINGYEDGSFKPDNNVTRAEFTAMLLRTRGMGSLGSTSIENPPFPDVTTSDVSWAIGNIRTAQGMGIINGYEDGTFRPKNNVSYEEAIKMIVCALGYENFGVAGNEWYSKYVMTANTLGFLDNSGGTIGTPATRATIAKMLYNCLEIKLAENNEETDKTILETDLKLKKKVGIIASNNVTSLSAPDTQLRENEIEIDAPTDDGRSSSVLVYKVDNADEYKDLFGAQITFYYSEDRTAETRTVVLATVEKSKSLTIDAKDIVPGECTTSSIAYYEDDDAKDTTTVAIDPAAYVIYNDKLYGSDGTNSVYSTYKAQKSLPTVGSIRLLDKNGDKTYDVVFVDDYETYIVSSITASNYTVVDSIFNKTITLDRNALNQEIKFVDAEGKESSFNNIRSGSVLSIKKSNPLNNGINYITVEINSGNNAVVSGTVKSMVAGKNVTINGETYEYSLQAPWMSGGAMAAPVMDDNGKFYLDRNGDIIAYDKTEVKANQYYGYLTETPYRPGGIGGEELYLDIAMLDTGKVKRYDVYDKTKINGNSFASYSDMINDPVNGLKALAKPTGRALYNHETPANDDVAQLIKFTTTTYKGKEVVDSIITATTATESASGVTVTGTSLAYYTTINAQDTSKYAATAKKMYKGSVSEGNASVNIGSNTMILRVPNDRTKDDNYKKLQPGDLNGTTPYYAEYYDVSTTTTASVVLVYNGASSSTAVSLSSPFVVITDIPGKEMNNSEGVAMHKLVGYDARNNRDITGWVSSSSEAVFAGIEIGDVVRLGTDSDGYYTLDAKHILFGANVNREAVKDTTNGDQTVSALGGKYHQFNAGTSEGGTAENPMYRVIWGSIHAKDSDVVNVSSKLIVPGVLATDITDVYSIERSKFNSARIYRYSKANDTLTMTQADATVIDDLADAKWSDADGSLMIEPAEVFVYLAANSVRLMIIVE